MTPESLNDSPADATAIPTLPAIVPGRSTEATLDLDEPAPLTSNGSGLDRSVWFAYLPDANRNVLADTCDANFDNHLDVCVGPIGALTPLPTTSDDYSGCLGERRTFAVTAGERVLLRVSADAGPRRGHVSPVARLAGAGGERCVHARRGPAGPRELRCAARVLDDRVRRAELRP